MLFLVTPMNRMLLFSKEVMAIEIHIFIPHRKQTEQILPLHRQFQIQKRMVIHTTYVNLMVLFGLFMRLTPIHLDFGLHQQAMV